MSVPAKASAQPHAAYTPYIPPQTANPYSPYTQGYAYSSTTNPPQQQYTAGRGTYQQQATYKPPAYQNYTYPTGYSSYGQPQMYQYYSPQAYGQDNSNYSVPTGNITGGYNTTR